jgi:hypothetical protein
MPLPTVAHDRGHGITSIRIYCAAGLVCPHWRVFTFDELNVPDKMPVIHIPRVRHFVCTKCGSRKVQVRSEWPARKPTGPFYSPSMGDRPRGQPTARASGPRQSWRVRFCYPHGALLDLNGRPS